MKKVKLHWQRLRSRPLLIIIVPLVFVSALLILFLSSRKFLDHRPCGCQLAEASPSGEFDPGETQAYFDNQPVDYPLAQLKPQPLAEAPAVLGETDESRWVEVDLSEQKLYAWQGNRLVYSFLVSTGKPWTPTVTGDFRVWIKLRYAKMSGGSREAGNYYYLPNVPYIQYFYRDYGLHGAYWHNNFGRTMSHGCVNLSILDAEKLFYWTDPVVPPGQRVVYASKENPGTRVVVHQ